MLSTASAVETSAFGRDGVPLQSKYPDGEMLFQKQKIRRDVQNMIPKIKTRSRPEKENMYIEFQFI